MEAMRAPADDLFSLLRASWAMRLRGQRRRLETDGVPRWRTGARGALLTACACAWPVAVGCSAPPATRPTAPISLEAAIIAAGTVDVAPVIKATIDARYPGSGPPPSRRDILHALYRPGEYSLLWLDDTGHPHDAAQEALRLLGASTGHGLVPADYDVDGLARQHAVLSAARAPSAEERAAFDVALSAGMLRYLRDLELGKADPRRIESQWNVPPHRHDFVRVLVDALANHRLTAAVEELAPPFSQYGALRAMLARYRTLAATGTRVSPTASSSIKPGDPYDGLAALQRYLHALGDLPADPLIESQATYDGPVVDGVKRFQVRHGLEPDGVIGPRTLAALRTPLSWRARQIELALERLRWLPHATERRLVAINIPMFRLWAWDAVPPKDGPSLDMRVIVGRATATETPIFAGQLRQVIFRPYWNIPTSILRGEILPALAKDPAYLRKHDMQIVRGPGDDAEQVEVTEANVIALRRGALRLRQRPGPRNALGLAKFVFPNIESIYLHGTPTQDRFSRTRRDFSHGCVRVEDPVALAEWVLAERSGWTRDRILTSMAGADTVPVTLPRPIDVLLFYTTVAVMPEDGAIWFVEDIYGQDARLDRALAVRPGP